MKIIKILFITVLFVVFGSLLLDTLSLVVFGQSGHSAYNIPHYFSESYVVLDDRYRNDTVLTNALALAPDDVSIGMTGGRWTISNDMTVAIGSHLFFDCDTYLYIETNVTLTINGSIDSAGYCQIFDGPGTIDGDPINDCLVREWFGDDLTVSLTEPYCDEYATTNWVIWYVGDHFTNSIQPWVTNWVINYVGDIVTNYASLVTNNYFHDGVTNNMEELIVRSNITLYGTINGYGVSNLVSEKIFFAKNTNVQAISLSGPKTYLDTYILEEFDYYDAFTLTNGVFVPPKNGWYDFNGRCNFLESGGISNAVDLFIERVGVTTEESGCSTWDPSSETAINTMYMMYCTTNDVVRLYVFEEDSGTLYAQEFWFNAIYYGEQ